MVKKLVILIILILSVACFSSDLTTIAEIDAEIALCNTQPAVVAAEQKAVFSPYIRAAKNSPTSKAALQVAAAKWDTERAKQITAYKASLVAMKAVIAEPNEIEPIEEDVNP
jgi:hypothetical protein